MVKKIGEEFKKQLINNGINPDNVIKFKSRYDKNKDVIITNIIMRDNQKHVIEFKTTWYASRKNKRW